MGEEDTYGFRNYKEGAASKASGTQLSEQSQLSYKPMTPKALPLPSGLGLTREQPLIEETHLHKDPSESQKGEGSQYGSSQASLKKASSRPELREENQAPIQESSHPSLTADKEAQLSQANTSSPLADEGLSLDKTPSPKPPSEPKPTSASRRQSGVRRRSQQDHRPSPDGHPLDSNQNSAQLANREDHDSQGPGLSLRKELCDQQSGEDEQADNVSAASGTQGQYDFQKGLCEDDSNKTQLHQDGSDKAQPSQQPVKAKNSMQELEEDDLFGDLPSYQPTMDKELRQSGFI